MGVSSFWDQGEAFVGHPEWDIEDRIDGQGILGETLPIKAGRNHFLAARPSVEGVDQVFERLSIRR